MENPLKRILVVLTVCALLPLLIFAGCDGMGKGSSESDVMEVNMSVEDDGIVTDLNANGDVIFAITESRSTGQPVTVTYTCSDCCGYARMIVINGGACDPGYRVSSAVIELNGETVFGPSDFNQNVHILEEDIILLPGENVLNITLRSRPGSKLTIIIERVPCGD